MSSTGSELTVFNFVLTAVKTTSLPMAAAIYVLEAIFENLKNLKKNYVFLSFPVLILFYKTYSSYRIILQLCHRVNLKLTNKKQRMIDSIQSLAIPSSYRFLEKYYHGNQP